MSDLDQRGLKPCPFCGSQDVAQGASRGFIAVWCRCGAQGPSVPFPEDCIEPHVPILECHGLWNRRAAPEKDEPVGFVSRMGMEDLKKGRAHVFIYPSCDHPDTEIPLYLHPSRSEEEIRREALFLIERLREFSFDHLADESSRDWYGHVEPSIERLTALATGEGK